MHHNSVNKKITTSSLLEKIDSGYTIITPTKRLARELQQQYSNQQKQLKKNAWPTADILPYEAWLMRLWQTIKVSDTTKTDNKTQWSVLNSWQAKRLWHQCIKHDIEKNNTSTAPLWNIENTAKSALKAWQVIHRWRLPIEQGDNYYLEDYRCFNRWHQAYQEKCQQQQWLDPECLAPLCIEHLTDINLSNSKFIWAAFDSYTPIQEALITALSERGVCATYDIAHNDISANDGDIHEYSDTRQQWLSIAQWAKQKISENKDYKIAVIVPNLQPYQAQIERIFEQTLSPEKLVDGVRKASAFHISLGKPISDYPIIKYTLALIAFCQKKPIANRDLLDLLTNPLITHSDATYFARSKLKRFHQERIPFETTFLSFATQLMRDDNIDKALATSLEKATAFLQQLDNKNSLSQWVEAFFNWLNLLGWPGPLALSSEDYQLVTTFKQHLSTMGSLDMIDKATSFDETYSILTTYLSTKPYQPEAPKTNIEIMGILESAGLNFDAIWFAGVVEKQWPPTTEKIAFLPYRLLKEAGYIGVDKEQASQHALKLQQKLLTQCTHFTASYHLNEQQQLQLASPLLLTTQAGDSTNIQPSKPAIADSLFKKVHTPNAELEKICDEQGLTLPLDYEAGGARIIENQANCPFKAYAQHRLFASSSAPLEAGLNAQDRGTLIHKILEKIWQQLKNQKGLNLLSVQSLEQLIDTVVVAETKQYTRSGLKAGHLAALNNWLKALLLEWLNLEKDRPAFAVLQLENALSLPLSGLVFRLKIDRIDQLEDNSIAIIDYKSGKTQSIDHWLGDRPKQPQLPLYALASQQQQAELALLCFAHIRPSECQLSGISDTAMTDSFKNIKSIEKLKNFDDIKGFSTLLNHWQSTLEQIAQEYRDGIATVTPQDTQACQYCDLPGLCRIQESTDR